MTKTKRAISVELGKSVMHQNDALSGKSDLAVKPYTENR